MVWPDSESTNQNLIAPRPQTQLTPYTEILFADCCMVSSKMNPAGIMPGRSKDLTHTQHEAMNTLNEGAIQSARGECDERCNLSFTTADRLSATISK